MRNLKDFKMKKKFLFIIVLLIIIIITPVFLINSSLKQNDFIKIPPNAKFGYVLFDPNPNYEYVFNWEISVNDLRYINYYKKQLKSGNEEYYILPIYSQDVSKKDPKVELDKLKNVIIQNIKNEQIKNKILDLDLDMNSIPLIFFLDSESIKLTLDISPRNNMPYRIKIEVSRGIKE